jgi:hypothetical protein
MATFSSDDLFHGPDILRCPFEPVPDCGCFGDAIILTNWETFYKNLVLIVFVIIIFFYRNRYRPWLTPRAANIFVLIIALGFAYFSYYQYRHLPWIDFLGWKVGTDLVPDDPGEAKIYLTYQNKVTGETKEYLSPHYPWMIPSGWRSGNSSISGPTIRGLSKVIPCRYTMPKAMT